MARNSLFSRRAGRAERTKADGKIAQLRAMNAAELADIGLKPGDVPHVERRIRAGA